MDHSAKVSLVPCESYEAQVVEQALDEVMDPLGGWEFVKPGMKIGIKANLVTFKKPEAAATTHPSLLIALVKRLTERGAEVIVGDSPGGVYSGVYLNRVYHATGMKEVENAGAMLNQDFSEKDTTFPEAMVAKEIHYTGWVDNMDLLINFCKLKTHGMMGMTAATKNMFGLIPGTYKPEYHYRYSAIMDFARMIVDLNDRFPCELYLADGIVGMEGNGPTAGTPRKIGCLLASRDPHALDAICAQIIGLDPLHIPTILAAKEKGYLPESLDQIEISRSVAPFVIKDYQIIKDAGSLAKDGNEALFGHGISRMLGKILAPKPLVTKAECIGCGECQRVCPAKAIEIKNKLPIIDRQACIRCFCCQEFCPKGAMKVHRSPVAKLAGKF